jgi:hypothetical protein
LAALAEATNGEGQTPYQVARLAGNTSVQEILEAFAADTDNFVYDVYCLEQQQQQEQQQQGEKNDNDKDNINDSAAAMAAEHNDDSDNNIGSDPNDTMTCQLEGGVGYWTPNGEIRLEKLMHDGQQNDMQDFDDDADIDEDSNDEAWTGNDYPEEDEDEQCNDDNHDEYNQDEHQWAMPAAAAAAAARRHRGGGGGGGSDSSDDDEDYYRPDQTFRYAKADIIEDDGGGDNDDGQDGEYDAAYGIY